MKRTQIVREVPAAGQESVWDYPRPPRAEASTERIVIVFGGETIVDTTDSVRVLETSHPPVYYLPAAAFRPGALADAQGQSFCEFKGLADYLSVRGGSQTASGAAWFYPNPSPGYESLVGRVAVYPSAMQQCTVDGEVVTSQEGDFYGGWITSRVVGPFKGAPGTLGW